MLTVLAIGGGAIVLAIMWLGVMALVAAPRHRHGWMDHGDEDADAAYSGRFPGH